MPFITCHPRPRSWAASSTPSRATRSCWPWSCRTRAADWRAVSKVYHFILNLKSNWLEKKILLILILFTLDRCPVGLASRERLWRHWLPVYVCSVGRGVGGGGQKVCSNRLLAFFFFNLFARDSHFPNLPPPPPPLSPLSPLSPLLQSTTRPWRASWWTSSSATLCAWPLSRTTTRLPTVLPWFPWVRRFSFHVSFWCPLFLFGIAYITV